MVLFILQKNIQSDDLIKLCFAKYLELTKKLNLSVSSNIIPNGITTEDFVKATVIVRGKKPYLSYNNKKIDICFNLSHTDGAMVIAFYKNEVGVDIEKIVDRDYKKIAVRQNFYKMPSSLIEFYDIWTKIEALTKQSGEGLIKAKGLTEKDLANVKTLHIVDGYVISITSCDNLLLSILT